MASGTVKWFDPTRGYGFIRPEQGEDVFVHISAVQASGPHWHLAGSGPTGAGRESGWTRSEPAAANGGSRPFPRC